MVRIFDSCRSDPVNAQQLDEMYIKPIITSSRRRIYDWCGFQYSSQTKLVLSVAWFGFLMRFPFPHLVPCWEGIALRLAQSQQLKMSAGGMVSFPGNHEGSVKTPPTHPYNRSRSEEDHPPHAAQYQRTIPLQNDIDKPGEPTAHRLHDCTPAAGCHTM